MQGRHREFYALLVKKEVPVFFVVQFVCQNSLIDCVVKTMFGMLDSLLIRIENDSALVEH